MSDPPRYRGRAARRDPSNRFTGREIEIDSAELDGDDTRPRTRYLDDTSRSVISRNTSPDIPFEASLNPYRGCEHGCSYCLAGDTPILMADGSHRALEALRQGDRIYGTSRKGHYRRYVETTVLDHWSSFQHAFRVTLDDGTQLIASGDHRFLSERGWIFVDGGESRHRSRPQLTRSDRLVSLARTSRGAPSAFPRGSALVKAPPDDVATALTSRSVTGIEDLEITLPMFDITTGTGDFIADGVVSHNCYARPSHEYLGLSAGLDFESTIFVKRDAAKLLREKLAEPSWTPTPLMLSGITDPYQPIERHLRVTRACLEVLATCRHPVSLITKNHLITRDLDLLAELAAHDAVRVTLSITTLDEELRASMEPRTSTAARRLDAVRALAEAGIPVGVNVAPIVPGLTDHEVPALLEAARDAGATSAGYTMLRLPGAVEPVFRDWLETRHPARAERILARVREMRGGRLNDPRFGHRMRGEGRYADQIRGLFDVTSRRLGLDRKRVTLSSEAFSPPLPPQGQPGLFDELGHG